MDQLHRFFFEGLPVRGMLVRLQGSWQELLARRDPGQGGSGAYPQPVRELLGEMAAASLLMQANIKFNGSLILQMQGEGPLKLAVAESQPDLRFRATATVVAEVAPDARLAELLNADGQGRCAITLDPRDRLPGQQPYQGIVPLHGDRREPLQALSQVLEHYMLQSEQLDTRLMLAADDHVAAGLLIQRLPVEGSANLAHARNEDGIGLSEDFNRIALLAATLTRKELLGLDAETILRRLYWEEQLVREAPRTPRFSCSCSRERVVGMLKGLGRPEVDSIIEEHAHVEVGCEFCGRQYRFDAVDVGELFTPPRDQAPGSSVLN